MLNKSEENAVRDLAEAFANNEVAVVPCLDRNTGKTAQYLSIIEDMPDGSVRAVPLAAVIEHAYSHLEPQGSVTFLDLKKT